MKRVFRFLRPLKENENMAWLRDHTVRQFVHECSDEWELNVTADSWLRSHSKCQLTEVSRLNPEVAIDYYDDVLCFYRSPIRR